MLRGLPFIVVLLASCVAASAQPTIRLGPPPGTSGDAPPVAIGPGWRYERRPPDVHMFHCRLDSCDRSSRVSYRILAPDNAFTLARFRSEQEKVAKLLEQRAPTGTRIAILGIEGDDNAKLPRMYKSRRLVTSPDGSKEYSVSALLLGARYAASLISSSRDEKASTANHALFGVAVLLVISPAADAPR